MSWPSSNTVPGGASNRRGIRLTSVLLPEPVGPTRRHAQVDVAQDGPAVVGEGQVAQLDLAAQRRDRGGLVVADLRLDLQDFPDAAHRRLAALEDVDHPAERDHRPVQHGQVSAEGHELAERDRAVHHHAAAEPEHDHGARAHEELDARIEAARHADEPAVALHQLAARLFEAGHLLGFLRVGPHHARAREVLLRERGQLRELRLHRLEAVVDLASEVPDEHGDEHQRDEREAQKRRADADHQRDAGHEGGARVRGVHDPRTEHSAHCGEVVAGPAHQVADPLRLVVARRQPGQVREEVVA
jgi:hypothetical protein